MTSSTDQQQQLKKIPTEPSTQLNPGSDGDGGTLPDFTEGQIFDGGGVLVQHGPSG